MTASGAETLKPAIPTWKKVIGGVLLALGAITFLLAQSATWVSNTFFNENNFVGAVEQVLSTEESRQAIASTIVSSSFENNPVAEQLIGKQVTSLVTGFLGSDLAGQLFDRLAHRSYAYLTSSDRQDIAINVAPIKTPLTAIIGIAENNGREVQFDPSGIPDTITLVESDSLPDISSYIRMILFASGLLWFISIASFAMYIYLYRKKLVHAIYVVGGSIILVSVIALFTGPFIPPAIASLINLITIRGVVENLTAALIYPFNVQLLSGLVIVSFVLLLVNLRGAIRQGILRLINVFK